MQLCVVELKPAVLRLLKLPSDSTKLGVENNKMLPRVKALLKHYMVDLIKVSFQLFIYPSLPNFFQLFEKSENGPQRILVNYFMLHVF